MQIINIVYTSVSKQYKPSGVSTQRLKTTGGNHPIMRRKTVKRNKINGKGAKALLRNNTAVGAETPTTCKQFLGRIHPLYEFINKT